jgi:hypothetical protein
MSAYTLAFTGGGGAKPSLGQAQTKSGDKFQNRTGNQALCPHPGRYRRYQKTTAKSFKSFSTPACRQLEKQGTIKLYLNNYKL